MYTWYNKQRPNSPTFIWPKFHSNAMKKVLESDSFNAFKAQHDKAFDVLHAQYLTDRQKSSSKANGIESDPHGIPQHSPGAPMTYNTPRATILNEAMEIVHKDRNANYGSPEDNFKQIAELWSAYKKVPFTPADVAIMNALIKVARLSKTPTHHDSAVDLAGYAACLGDIQASMKGVSPLPNIIPDSLNNRIFNRSV